MGKVLVSWLGVEKDFNTDGSVNLSGPTINFYKHYYEYDFHVLLVTEDNVEKGLEFKKTIDEKFKNIFIILKPQAVEGVHWNIKQVKHVSEQVLMELKDYQIDILFSTGSAIMKIAWFIAHYTLNLNTRLLQIIRQEESVSRKRPDLYVLDFETSDIPLKVLIRQFIVGRDYTQDLILTPSIQKVYDKAFKIAQSSDSHIFLTGPRGIGKLTLAKYIHQSSVREKRPFNTLDCAAYPEQEIEYRLLGFKKGAFPGAISDSKGLLVESHGGTLYLENFDKLSYRLQNIIYRFMDDGFVHPIIGRDKKVNVRFIFGINEPMKNVLTKGTVMPELYYRVGLSLHLSGLADLPVDERQTIIKQVNERKAKSYHKRSPLNLCRELMDFLISYSFPANFTELQTLFDNLYIFAEGDTVCVDLLPDYINLEKQPSSYSLEDVEKLHIEKVLRIFKGNKSRTARALGVALNTLKKKINDYNIDIDAIIKNAES